MHHHHHIIHQAELAVSVHLMADETESVNFIMSPGASLDALLRQLYIHRDFHAHSESDSAPLSSSMLSAELT